MPFQEGNKLGEGRIPGSKNLATLIKEERRRVFDEKISQKWEEIIDKLPPSYVADQFLGKAKDEMDVTIKEEPSERIKDLAKKLMEANGIHQRGDNPSR